MSLTWRTIPCGVCSRKLHARSRMRGLRLGRWRGAVTKDWAVKYPVSSHFQARAHVALGARRRLALSMAVALVVTQLQSSRSTSKKMCRRPSRSWRRSTAIRIPLPPLLHGKIRHFRPRRFFVSGRGRTGLMAGFSTPVLAQPAMTPHPSDDKPTNDAGAKATGSGYRPRRRKMPRPKRRPRMSCREFRPTPRAIRQDRDAKRPGSASAQIKIAVP